MSVYCLAGSVQCYECAISNVHTQGSPGEPGSRGLPGKNGEDGQKGMRGDSGMKGEKGIDGGTGQIGKRADTTCHCMYHSQYNHYAGTKPQMCMYYMYIHMCMFSLSVLLCCV